MTKNIERLGGELVYVKKCLRIRGQDKTTNQGRTKKGAFKYAEQKTEEGVFKYAEMCIRDRYTAIQQGVIDGAENNELALTNNKHGEVAKYYAYNKHQMVPDMLVANLKFLESLSPEEYEIFKDAAALSTQVEMDEWDKSIEEAKNIAVNDMGVEFIDVDVDAFKQKVLPLHETMQKENPKIVDLYQHIQEANEKAKGGQ